MHDENIRVKKIREAVNLTQQAFAKKMGFSRAVITNIEYGKTDVKEAVRLAICRVFNVNYFWLTEGKGEMFTSTPETVVEELVEQYNLDDIDKKIIEKYLELDAEQRKVLKEYLKSIFVQE